MLDPRLLLLYLPFACLLTLTPGPDTVFVLTRGVTKGRSAGLLSTLGIVSGLSIHTFAAAIGVSAIIATSVLAFNALKLIGACYLIYLGIRAWMDKSETMSLSEPRKGEKLFRQGFISNATNPKVAVFYLTVLPQFVNPRLGHVGLQISLLGLIHAFTVLVWLGVVSFLAAWAGAWLQRTKRFWVWQRRVTASVFVGLGLKLALTKQK